MAKVKFTSAISEIRGKLRGDVFKGFKQGFSLQNKAKPPYSSTEKQVANRIALISLIRMYAGLSDEFKSLWEVYGSSVIPPISGQNAYTKLNLPILTAFDSGFSINSTPPPEPEALFPPTQFAYWPNEDGTFQIFWLPFDDLTCATSIWKARLPGFSLLNRERWSYVRSILNSTPTCLTDNPFLINVPLVFRLRTLSKYGNVSIYTPRARPEPRTLYYFDRCETPYIGFSGNWYSFGLDTDRIEGHYSYNMQFRNEVNEYIAFAYEFPAPEDWSAYKSIHFLLKSSRDLPFEGIAGFNVVSQRNGDTIPATYTWSSKADFWKYFAFELPAKSEVPGTFNIEQVIGLHFYVEKAYPVGERTYINLDHVHLEEGVSVYVPPPPPPPPPNSQGPLLPTDNQQSASIGTMTWTNPEKIYLEDGDNAVTTGAITTEDVFDESVRLYIDDNPAGEEKASLVPWPAILGSTTYGGPYDKWGVELTPEIINNVKFGLWFAARGNLQITYALVGFTFNFSIPEGATVTGISVEVLKCQHGPAEVDCYKMTVYYIPAA